MTLRSPSSRRCTPGLATRPCAHSRSSPIVPRSSARPRPRARSSSGSVSARTPRTRRSSTPAMPSPARVRRRAPRSVRCRRRRRGPSRSTRPRPPRGRPRSSDSVTIGAIRASMRSVPASRPMSRPACRAERVRIRCTFVASRLVVDRRVIVCAWGMDGNECTGMSRRISIQLRHSSTRQIVVSRSFAHIGIVA